MRARRTTLAAAAAALATGLALPATIAQAATVAASSLPKPQHSLYVAGYQQTGCHDKGYPVYVEISGTIKVPAATDVNGTGQEWAATNADASASRCQVAAYEKSPYPAYDHTTKTSAIAFRDSQVWWGEKGQGKASTSKLLGQLPAHARLNRFSLVTTKGSVVAVTSKPADHNSNFTVTGR
jgi:hypothetical protein